MSLLSLEQVSKIPEIGSQEDKGAKAIAYIKLFTPDANWSWYIMEIDSDQNLCFGLVDGHEKELGYFSLEEIEEIKGPFGLKVEVDNFFKESELKKIAPEFFK